MSPATWPVFRYLQAIADHHVAIVTVLVVLAAVAVAAAWQGSED